MAVPQRLSLLGEKRRSKIQCLELIVRMPNIPHATKATYGCRPQKFESSL